jgi:hypothetical protein
VPMFIAMQLVGFAVAAAVLRALRD